MNRYVISDIHGNIGALRQCLNLANFNVDEDLLIVNGDVCDRWPDTKSCVDLILSIKNRIIIKGNHDEWFLKYINKKMNWMSMDSWTSQGGLDTLKSYMSEDEKVNIPDSHKDFFNNSVYYYELDNFLFVHAGYYPKLTIEEHSPDDLIWDRTFAYNMVEGRTQKHIIYDKVFIGHTPTFNFKSNKGQPIIIDKVALIDTGVSYNYPLTIMNIDTLEYFQSENGKFYYN